MRVGGATRTSLCPPSHRQAPHLWPGSRSALPSSRGPATAPPARSAPWSGEASLPQDLQAQRWKTLKGPSSLADSQKANRSSSKLTPAQRFPSQLPPCGLLLFLWF